MPRAPRRLPSRRRVPSLHRLLALIPLAALALAGPWQLHPLVLVFALSGSLMISKTLRIPKP